MLGSEPMKLRSSVHRAVALLALLCAVGLAPAARAMEFAFVPIDARDWCRRTCPVAVAADGSIELDSAARFEAFVAAVDRGDGVLVFLNSSGGNVVGAMRLGQAFRRMKADVAIASQAFDAQGAVRMGAGRCLSACVYAFMGGVRRVAPNGASVGIHRMYSDSPGGLFGLGSERSHDDGSLLDLVAHYAQKMGVSGDLVRVAEKYDSGTMHILTRDEIDRWKLASDRY